MILEPRITRMWVSEGELLRTRSGSRKSMQDLASIAAKVFLAEIAVTLQSRPDVQH